MYFWKQKIRACNSSSTIICLETKGYFQKSCPLYIEFDPVMEMFYRFLSRKLEREVVIFLCKEIILVKGKGFERIFLLSFLPPSPSLPLSLSLPYSSVEKNRLILRPQDLCTTLHTSPNTSPHLFEAGGVTGIEIKSFHQE